MRNLVWVATPDVAAPAEDGTAAAGSLSLVVTLVEPGAGEEGQARQAERLDVSLPTQYAGSDYHVEATWLPSALLPDAGGEGFDQAWQAWIQPVARWVVYRAYSALPATRDVILWAPVDGQ
jgi:hypothetical protein